MPYKVVLVSAVQQQGSVIIHFLLVEKKVLASGTFSEFQTADSDSNQRSEGMQKEMSSAMKPGLYTSSEDVHSNLILIPELF